jgi:hypothetical protein
MLLGKSAHETALDKIVCTRQIAGQSARITAQPRDLCLDQLTEIVHRSTSFSRPPEEVARLTRERVIQNA